MKKISLIILFMTCLAANLSATPFRRFTQSQLMKELNRHLPKDSSNLYSSVFFVGSIPIGFYRASQYEAEHYEAHRKSSRIKGAEACIMLIPLAMRLPVLPIAAGREIGETFYSVIRSTENNLDGEELAPTAGDNSAALLRLLLD
ncbi:MAG: hypothetical protein AB8C84_01495 [Oligoflexales bacterium]